MYTDLKINRSLNELKKNNGLNLFSIWVDSFSICIKFDIRYISIEKECIYIYLSCDFDSRQVSCHSRKKKKNCPYLY